MRHLAPTLQSSQLITKTKQIFAYWPLIVFIASIALSIFATPYWLVYVVLCGYLVFHGTLNTVQGVGPIYWISRDYEVSQGFRLSSGFMREIDAPWRTGKGIQIALFKRSFQVGVCRKVRYRDETEANLGVIGARFMDTEPTEIGNW